MDLNTAAKKLAAGEYESVADIKRDVTLVLSNARLVHAPESQVWYTCAAVLCDRQVVLFTCGNSETKGILLLW
jgi:hypothetical protein